MTLPLQKVLHIALCENVKGATTLEYKQEAVRLVESGQSIAAAARSLGVSEQTLWDWVRANKAGRLVATGRGSKLTAEQIEIRQLRAENVRRWSATYWEKRRRTPRGARDEVRPYLSQSLSLAGSPAVLGSEGQLHGLLPASCAAQASHFSPPPGGSGFGGSRPCDPCRVAWCLWLAQDVARLASPWGAGGQGAGAAADATAWHSRVRQTAVNRRQHTLAWGATKSGATPIRAGQTRLAAIAT